MIVPARVTSYLDHQAAGRIVRTTPVSGGCISTASRLDTSDGSSWFLKTNANVADDFFQAEARGLAALAHNDAPLVPTVFTSGRDFILMEWLESGPPAAPYWEEFGQLLANLHNQPAPSFGFPCDTFCGATRQPNTPTNDGYDFYTHQRYGYQIALARNQGLLTKQQVQSAESFAARLPNLVPLTPPALLHGDLWSGNIHCTSRGQPALIDPAVYWGWAEADLAMTTLFGSFPESFYTAYENTRPAISDWRKRIDIHNCYHLLNHANLFGGSYLQQAFAIINHYI